MQKMWSLHNERIAENTRINKEVLKTVLLSKTERKINWIRFKAISSLIIPIPLFIIIALPRLEFRMDLKFIIGTVLFGAVCIPSYVWTIKYILALEHLDVLKPITTIKKQILKVEKYKMKITKLAIILGPLGIAGVYLIGDMPLFSVQMLPFNSLVLVVMGISAYLSLKHGTLKQLKRINSEIDKILNLEKG